MRERGKEIEKGKMRKREIEGMRKREREEGRKSENPLPRLNLLLHCLLLPWIRSIHPTESSLNQDASPTSLSLSLSCYFQHLSFFHFANNFLTFIHSFPVLLALIHGSSIKELNQVDTVRVVSLHL